MTGERLPLLLLGETGRELRKVTSAAARSPLATSKSAMIFFLALADSFNSLCIDMISSSLSFSKKDITSSALVRRTVSASLALMEDCFSLCNSSTLPCKADKSVSIFACNSAISCLAIIRPAFISSAETDTLLLSASDISNCCCTLSNPVSPEEATAMACISSATNFALSSSVRPASTLLACPDSFNFTKKESASSFLLCSDTRKSSCAPTRTSLVELHTSTKDFNCPSISLSSSSLLA